MRWLNSLAEPQSTERRCFPPADELIIINVIQCFIQCRSISSRKVCTMFALSYGQHNFVSIQLWYHCQCQWSNQDIYVNNISLEWNHKNAYDQKVCAGPNGNLMESEWFNIDMLSYQSKSCNCGDHFIFTITIFLPSRYLYIEPGSCF